MRRWLLRTLIAVLLGALAVWFNVQLQGIDTRPGAPRLTQAQLLDRHLLTWMNAMIFTSLVATVLVVWELDDYLKRTLRLRAGQCPKCAYDLRGAPDSAACPECGATIVSCPSGEPQRETARSA